MMRCHVAGAAGHNPVPLALPVRDSRVMRRLVHRRDGSQSGERGARTLYKPRVARQSHGNPEGLVKIAAPTAVLVGASLKPFIFNDFFSQGASSAERSPAIPAEMCHVETSAAAS